MNPKILTTIKAALIWIALTAVLVCTTLSVLGIWDVVGDHDTLSRAVATLAVVIFGCLIAGIISEIGSKQLNLIARK